MNNLKDFVEIVVSELNLKDSDKKDFEQTIAKLISLNILLNLQEPFKSKLHTFLKDKNEDAISDFVNMDVEKVLGLSKAQALELISKAIKQTIQEIMNEVSTEIGDENKEKIFKFLAQ